MLLDLTKTLRRLCNPLYEICGEEVHKRMYNECYFGVQLRGAGYIRFKDGFQESFPVEDYLDLFDLAAHNIQKEISGNSSGDHRTLQLITGEHMSKCLCVWVGMVWYY